MNKLLVLEGGDGSGKTIQTEFLYRRLTKEGVVSVFDFPQYETSVFGQMLRRLLDGEFGDFSTFPSHLAAMPYMLDRVVALPKLREALTRGHVICNRYVTSNIAHQAAKLPRSAWPDFISWVERCEYDTLGLPRPDAVFYLQVPVRISTELSKQKRVGDLDVVERNIVHQAQTRDVYDELIRLGKVIPVMGTDAAGALRSPEAVHADIWQSVQAMLT